MEMRIVELVVLYLCVGLAVGAAASGPRRWIGVPLWPLVLPTLLARASDGVDPATNAPTPASTGTSADIERALGHLVDALRLWQGAPTLPLHGMRAALTDLDTRRNELATLLARPAYRASATASDPAAHDADAERRANVAAMAAIHDHLRSQFVAALARIDELATRIELAHYAGRGMGDVTEGLTALVAAVEGLRAAHAEVDTHGDAGGTRA